MAKAQPPKPRLANLSADEMRAALPKLARRKAELAEFDVSTITRRFDPTAEALVTKVNATLREVLGPDSVEFNEHQLGTLDTLPIIIGGGGEPLQRVHEGYREGIRRALIQLNTLTELWEERIADAPTTVAYTAGRRTTSAHEGRRVFIVHGHDEVSKTHVARFLEKLDLEPIVLHEQPNAGRTVIEKFEANADVSFAVVLFTPDDIGHAIDKPTEARPRARQNVVLELGYFTGVLGRERVCILHRGNVEVPSDYLGVLSHELDSGGAWRLMLAREMRAAGIDIDLNKAL